MQSQNGWRQRLLETNLAIFLKNDNPRKHNPKIHRETLLRTSTVKTPKSQKNYIFNR